MRAHIAHAGRTGTATTSNDLPSVDFTREKGDTRLHPAGGRADEIASPPAGVAAYRRDSSMS